VPALFIIWRSATLEDEAIQPRVMLNAQGTVPLNEAKDAPGGRIRVIRIDNPTRIVVRRGRDRGASLKPQPIFADGSPNVCKELGTVRHDLNIGQRVAKLKTERNLDQNA
jgi:hypothetical protein